MSARLRQTLLIVGIPAVLLLVPTLWVLGPPAAAYLAYAPQEGDVVFQSLPHAPLVNAIEGGTRSPWSHCGIVAYEDGRWVVYEALGSVRRTSLAEWFWRSRAWQFAAYRIRPEHAAAIPAALENVRTNVGKPYDVRYELDDEKIYCSELVYKGWLAATGQGLGKLVRLGDLHWQPYQQLIEMLEGGSVPVERMMITPRDLALAPELELVTSHGVELRPRLRDLTE